jgi:hypothetical protein
MKAIEQLTLFLAAILAAILTAFARPMAAVPAGWDEWDPFATRCSDGPCPGYADREWLGGPG